MVGVPAHNHMAEKRDLLIELGILGVMGYFLFFISVAVNPTLGSIYTLPVILAIVLAMVDYFFGSKTIKLISKNLTWTQAILWGIGGYVALILSTQLASGLAQIIPLKEILSLLGASAPVFSNSAILNYISFSFLIAYVETMAFFIIALDLFASMFKVQINKQNLFNPKLILITLGLSLAFMLYHVQAKGIENESILILVFFMAVISLFTIIWTQDARPSILIHVISNSIASATIFGVVSPLAICLPLMGGA